MGQHSADPAVKTIWKMPARHGMAARESAEISWSYCSDLHASFLEGGGERVRSYYHASTWCWVKKSFFFLSSSPISSRRCWRTVRPAEWPLKHAVSLIHRRRNSSTQLNGYFGKQRQFLCNPDRESRKLLTGLFALRSLIFKRGVCTRKCTKDFWSITIKLRMTLTSIYGC